MEDNWRTLDEPINCNRPRNSGGGVAGVRAAERQRDTLLHDGAGEFVNGVIVAAVVVVTILTVRASER
jgi:hypothetical protein